MEIKEEIKRKPTGFVTEKEIRAIQAKEYLTLKEAALLLNIIAIDFKEMDLIWKNTFQKSRKKAFARQIILLKCLLIMITQFH